MFRLGCSSGSFDIKTIYVTEDDKTEHGRTKDIINIDKGNLLISKILIFDILGKKILEEYKVSSKLDVSHLDKGIYMIEIHSEYKIFKSKFIKM